MTGDAPYAGWQALLLTSAHGGYSSVVERLIVAQEARVRIPVVTRRGVDQQPEDTEGDAYTR